MDFRLTNPQNKRKPFLLRAGVRLRNVMTKANGSDDSVGFLNYRHYRAPFQCAATKRRTKSRKIPIDAHSKISGGALSNFFDPTAN